MCMTNVVKRTATFTCRCVFLFGYTQQRLVRALRIDLFRSLLRQDIGFFDAEATGNISSRLTSDCAGLVTLNPKPSTLNPQPSTLNPNGQLHPNIYAIYVCPHTSTHVSADTTPHVSRATSRRNGQRLDVGVPLYYRGAGAHWRHQRLHVLPQVLSLLALLVHQYIY